MNLTRIRFRRDTAANWSSVNPVLLMAEPGYETDTRKMKLGDGATPWNDLPYLANGQQVPPGESLPTYTHVQSTPATVWTINHNLGFRPSVELFDVGGQEFDADILHTSINQVIIYLNIAAAGTARLN